MAIFVNHNTFVMIQGITGRVGRTYAERMVVDGTNLVAGVTPGKGGQEICEVPVFNTVLDAMAYDKRINCSLVSVPAPFARDAVLEALHAGVKLVVVYTEGVPLHDTISIIAYANMKGARIIGPNAAGVVSPGLANVSDLNSNLLKQGKVGIVSKSGTLTYEVFSPLIQDFHVGFSTIVCLGGDPIIGTGYLEVLREFEKDEATELIILLGEPGGHEEQECSDFLRQMQKPIVGYIAGKNIPRNKPVGHAGTIITEKGEDAESKSKMLQQAGVTIADLISDIPPIVVNKMKSEL